MGRPRKNAKATAGQKRKADALYEDSGWIIECPGKPDSAQPRGVTDIFKDNDNPGVEELAIDFSIRPGSKWSSIKGYTNVKYQDQTFSPRDCIFVNRTDPPPPPPSEDAPPEEVLKYQRDNMWVGRIQQAKAESPAKVWLRVFWYYWPEELPMGAQHYHGQSELVLSNYTDIIDATTISGRAEISHWDEFKDGDDDRNLNALYWRQTFDVSKSNGKKKGALSNIRKHCTCRKEYNPDKTMFKCLKSNCGIWNHVECLEEDLRDELESRLEKRSLQGYLDRRSAAYQAELQEKSKSLGTTIAVGIANAISSAKHVIEGAIEEQDADPSVDTEKTPVKSHKTKGSRQASRLRIAISNSGPGAENDNGAVVAKIKLLPQPNAESKEVKEWTIKLDCLQCGESLD